MSLLKVVVSDFLFEDLQPEIDALAGIAEVSAMGRYPGAAEFLARASDADGILCQMAPLDREVMQGLRKCRVIVRYGVGVDNLDVAGATEAGIAVCNVPDYCTDDVADHTLTLMLGLVRKLPASIDQLKRGGWGHPEIRPIRRLASLTLGCFGFGRIARSVCARALAFGFKVVAYDPYVPDVVFQAAGVTPVDQETLLRTADVITLHMPLTDDTRGLLSDETLSQAKRGVHVVNTARGGLIDTPSLIRALDSGQVGGAALDVLDVEPIRPDHPLWQRPNVFMTGHLAWYSEEALRQLQRQVGEECARVLRGEEPRSCVNPEHRERR